MKMIDLNGVELQNPDLSMGHLDPDRLLIAHHDAIAAVKEKWHYETVAEYPNGGKDVVRVVDVPGVAAKDAWDEYEEVLRYIPYTAEELEEIEANRKPTMEEKIAELREVMDMILSALEKNGMVIK